MWTELNNAGQSYSDTHTSIKVMSNIQYRANYRPSARSVLRIILCRTFRPLFPDSITAIAGREQHPSLHHPWPSSSSMPMPIPTNLLENQPYHINNSSSKPIDGRVRGIVCCFVNVTSTHLSPIDSVVCMRFVRPNDRVYECELEIDTSAGQVGTLAPTERQSRRPPPPPPMSMQRPATAGLGSTAQRCDEPPIDIINVVVHHYRFACWRRCFRHFRRLCRLRRFVVRRRRRRLDVVITSAGHPSNHHLYVDGMYRFDIGACCWFY